MQYKIRFRPAFSLLYITLKPGERIFAAAGALVSLDEGLVVKPGLGLGVLRSLWFRCLGGNAPVVSFIHNPTTESLTLVLSKAVVGDLLPLDVTKNGLCLAPDVYLAYTSGIRLTLHWVGWSSWWAGYGLYSLKLEGKGRVFLGKYGQVSPWQVHERMTVEHKHLLAYSPKVQLRVNFPKGLVGSHASGEGTVSQLIGKGVVYLQSRSMSGLNRYLRLKFR